MNEAKPKPAPDEQSGQGGDEQHPMGFEPLGPGSPSQEPQPPVRAAVMVTAGTAPGVADERFTRSWSVSSSAEWMDGDSKLIAAAEMAGRAAGYAQLLVSRPDLVRWVSTEWLWQ